MYKLSDRCQMLRQEADPFGIFAEGLANVRTEFTPHIIPGEWIRSFLRIRNIGALTDLLIVSGKNGLSSVQFNTVDADTLIDARMYPENHKNLAVRVSGFSQKFHLLHPDLQDHIIERTKHSCM